jgi:hypothetical protein
MCHLRHLRIKSISIGIEGLDGGEISHESPFRAAHGSTGDELGTRLQVEKTVMLCLAGPLAQQKYLSRGSGHDYGGALDLDTASIVAMRFFHSRKTAAAYLKFASEWVRQILDEPRVWAAVERLARALLQKRKISGSQAEAIIRGGQINLRSHAPSPTPRTRRR